MMFFWTLFILAALAVCFSVLGFLIGFALQFGYWFATLIQAKLHLIPVLLS